MEKLIDIIFPVAPLPKDKKERNAVTDGYEKSIEATTNSSIKLLVLILPFLFVAISSVSNWFSIINVIIYVCILLPALLYFISWTILLYYRLKSSTSMHAKHMVTILNSFVFVLCFIDIFLGALRHSIDSGKNIGLEAVIYFLILGCAALSYYIGYWYFLKRFNLQMKQCTENHSTIKEIGITIGLLGGWILKDISYYFLLLSISVVILLIAWFCACGLVNYRQYDNIQRAKKGMTFK